ncbi:hypothetical protein CB0940_07964 [Cercospora beticola]|uniref:Uncharacterized protein n=1 Tax=Cercospora beticola TaxID=122368 RepID=A0A2G5H917_CERBT|nr:hypothetical protein CB0940_07964 [Cercospora beticola]PIA88722.1 hypothetical protein CB0940_07964 [Cercospora beticola]WPB08546.1 hypothetical protein RHO25_013212 [Cercospora beticola]CAK1356590.1 unnamed protein product [Cercospora beticola]
MSSSATADINPHTPPPQSPNLACSAPTQSRPISPPLTITPSPPPASSSLSALTSDSARDIVRLFRQHGNARAENDIVRDDVERAVLTEALDHLRAHEPETWHNVQERTRWEYNAATKQLRFRMVSAFHESICESIERKIRKYMRDAIRNSPLPPEDRERALHCFTTDICSTGSADVQHGYSEGTVLSAGGKDSPDKSWTFGNAKTAVFVLEFAWSEQLRHLKEKSERYVLDTTTDVRTVLGISSDYSAVEKTTAPPTKVLRYRRYFRDGEYGLAKWGPKDISRDWVFTLRLSDFVPWNVSAKHPHFQTWSDAVGNVTFPSRLFRDVINQANKFRNPPSPGSAVDDLFATAVLGVHEREDSEPTSSPSEQTDSLPLPASADQSFGSTTSASEYSPDRTSVVVGATPADPPRPGLPSRLTRSKRTKIVDTG